MRILHLCTSKMRTNTYIAINSDHAFIVDAGDDAQRIACALEEQKVTLEAILLTHAHFDHMGAVAELTRIAPKTDGRGIAVFMHCADVDKIGSYNNMGFAVGVKVEPFVPDVLLKGGERIKVAGVDISVIHTPGHTKGGVCYIAEDKIFSGDTLFKCSYGRTDLYDGSFAEIKNSIVNKLFRLRGDYTVLAGHGESTTLEFERRNNPVIFEDGGNAIITD